MKLTSVAKHFNRTPFTDAYQPDTYFMGRLMPFDDATRDSLSSERRILVTDTQASIPFRRAIQSNGETFLVGDLSKDYVGEETLRHKYVLHQAKELAKLYTFENLLQGVVTKELWANRLWVKGTKETDESSGVYDNYTIYVTKTEDIRHPSYPTGEFFDGREQNVLIFLEDRYHLVRTSYVSAGGFVTAVVDELPDPVVLDVSYISRTHQPVPDTYAETTTAIKLINLRWQSNFTYLTRYSQKYENGDTAAKILKSVTPTAKSGDHVLMGSRRYKVVAVTDEDAIFHLHLRRV